MSNTKAIIDFSGYTAATLGPAAQAIHDGMTGNGTFLTPPVDMNTFQSGITNFNEALAAKTSRATADVIAFIIARHDLEGMLSELGNYVNQTAQGDITVVLPSGFPYYTTAHPADNSPPAAPANVVLRHGDLPGSIVARYHPDRAHSSNEVQTDPGDPTVEANWVHAGIFGGGKATLSGLTVGSTIWVRIRTAGLKGVMGAWSNPAMITVT